MLLLSFAIIITEQLTLSINSSPALYYKRPIGKLKGERKEKTRREKVREREGKGKGKG